MIFFIDNEKICLISTKMNLNYPSEFLITGTVFTHMYMCSEFDHAEQIYARKLGVALDFLRANGVVLTYATDPVLALHRLNQHVPAFNLMRARTRLGLAMKLRQEARDNLELLKAGRFHEIKQIQLVYVRYLNPQAIKKAYEQASEIHLALLTKTPCHY